MKLFNIWSNTLYENENINDIYELLEAAVKKGADLEDANLEGVYLIDANLRKAKLDGANLEGTTLIEVKSKGEKDETI